VQRLSNGKIPLLVFVNGPRRTGQLAGRNTGCDVVRDLIVPRDDRMSARQLVERHASMFVIRRVPSSSSTIAATYGTRR